MKRLITFCTVLALAATSVAAGSRTEVEADLLAAATRGNENMTVALDAFKAGDTAKGCQYLTAARDNMIEALGLVANDRVLVEHEPDSSQKTTDLSDLDGMKAQFSDMRDRMNVQLEKRC